MTTLAEPRPAADWPAREHERWLAWLRDQHNDICDGGNDCRHYDDANREE